MNNNLTEIVFILDRSGSMAGLEADTVGGFNAMVERQKKEEGTALLSAVLFSNDSEVLYDRTDIRRHHKADAGSFAGSIVRRRLQRRIGKF